MPLTKCIYIQLGVFYFLNKNFAPRLRVDKEGSDPSPSLLLYEKFRQVNEGQKSGKRGGGANYVRNVFMRGLSPNAVIASD